MTKKRDLFAELQQGLKDISKHQQGLITLRHCTISEPHKLRIKPKFIKDLRAKLNLSQSVFARLFRVSKRTLEKWEQGRSMPNEQAIALLLLVNKTPSLLQDLAQLEKS